MRVGDVRGDATVAGARVRPIPTRLENGFRIPDDDELDALVTPRTRAILFSNPANPTGAVTTRSDVARIVAWARRHEIFVIADEVYRRIWFTSPPTSVLELDDARDHVVCVDSLSKTYSLCGLRVGFFVSRNRELMERVERLGRTSGAEGQGGVGVAVAAAVAAAGVALRLGTGCEGERQRRRQDDGSRLPRELHGVPLLHGRPRTPRSVDREGGAWG